MANQEQKRQMRWEILCILLLSLIFTGVAYVNYRPITGPEGALFIGKLEKVRNVSGVPGYLALTGFGDADNLRISRTEETLLLLDDPASLGKEYTIRAEKRDGSGRSNIPEIYYQVTSMKAKDGSFSFSWEDYAAIQAESLCWILPLAFGIVWVFGGFYLFIRYSEPPKRRYAQSNTRRRKYKRRK